MNIKMVAENSVITVELYNHKGEWATSMKKTKILCRQVIFVKINIIYSRLHSWQKSKRDKN